MVLHVVRTIFSNPYRPLFLFLHNDDLQKNDIDLKQHKCRCESLKLCSCYFIVIYYAISCFGGFLKKQLI